MTITFNEVRYIKLGPKGNMSRECLEQNKLFFGYEAVPHELAAGLDRDAIKSYLMDLGRDAKSAAEEARQVVDFYGLGADCLWITLVDDHLWWTFAAPEVTWHPRGDGGDRTRDCIGQGWRNSDLNGEALLLGSLSTRLTQVGTYRRTICGVEAKDYLLRRLNGQVEPLVARSEEARDALLRVTEEIIEALTWRDFETLTDAMFARSGWHRASALGGTQKDIDIALDQPTTGERAAVQVKSSAAQRDLRDFIDRCDKVGGFDRLFFVCHSPAANMKAPSRADVHLWRGRELAETVLRLGLYDWLIKKVA